MNPSSSSSSSSSSSPSSSPSSPASGSPTVRRIRWEWPFLQARRFRDPAPPIGSPATGETDSFTDGVFAHAGGVHPYKLYVPQGHTAPASLVVMLHGCGQTASDFAVGTDMNAHAAQQGAFVLYPEQSRSANANGCWNWFQPGHQKKGQGEPAWIAALTTSIARRFRIPPQRIFIAGLSAGGTMAATVSAAYPRLFAACCVHSGLAASSAHNAIGALATMRRGIRSSVLTRRRPVPTIVFHGRLDDTVHPSHAQQIIDAAMGGGLGKVRSSRLTEVAWTDADFTRKRYLDASGERVVEHWDLHRVGHAWSGGSAKGSHTAPSGPSASAAALRFFLERDVHAGKKRPASAALAGIEGRP